MADFSDAPSAFVLLRHVEEPDELRNFELGKFEILYLGGKSISRATYQPG